MTEEQFIKARELRIRIQHLKEQDDLPAVNNHSSMRMVVVEFVDREKYNKLKAEAIADLQKELEAI